jgi:hypothetical protein
LAPKPPKAARQAVMCGWSVAFTVAAGFRCHGALSTYERRGSTRERGIGKHRWVVRTIVLSRGRAG